MVNGKEEQTNETIEINELRPKIVVIGVGGAGGNAVNNMIRSSLEGVNFIVANTDSQALSQSLVQYNQRIQLGMNITRGLGAGSKPEVGNAAAEESLEEILNFISGANMVFITAGMGGGTGTGAAPVIAKAAKDAGILTVGVVTKPFSFEGSNRTKIAEHGIEDLQRYVDTLLVIPNQNLFRLASESTTFAEAFKMADNVLYSGVRGVTDLMIMPGLINLDFADIRTIMSEMGKAMMGTGEAEGERRAIDAAEAAISNPLLDDVSLQGANGVLINITGGFDMTLYEVDEAANRIREEVESDANIIFGSTFDERMNGRIRVSVVATGIGGAPELSSFKNRDMAGIQLKSNSSSAKVFKDINSFTKNSQADEKTEEQQVLSPEFIDNYQEIPFRQEEEKENSFAVKKSGTFFDRFRSKSSKNLNVKTNNSQFKKSVFQNEQQNFLKNFEEQYQNSNPVIQEEDEEYDIPACFRRKNDRNI